MGKLYQFPPLSERQAQRPVLDVIDGLSADTPAMGWLRGVGPIARKLNEESERDPGGEAA